MPASWHGANEARKAGKSSAGVEGNKSWVAQNVLTNLLLTDWGLYDKRVGTEEYLVRLERGFYCHHSSGLRSLKATKLAKRCSPG